MESQDPVLHCLDRLNLGEHAKLRERSQYFYNQCSKVPPKVLSKGINSRPVISIQLACESLGISDFDQASANKLAMCTAHTYTNILKAVRKCLDIQPRVTMKTLGVALGCTSMIPYVEKFFTEFQTRYISSLSAVEQLATEEELALPMWKGGTFYICSKALGAKIEKESIAKQCSCTSTDLTRVARTIEEKCKDLIVELKRENTRSSRPRRGHSEEKNDAEHDQERAGSKRKSTKRSGDVENSSEKKMKASDKASTSIIPSKKKTPVSGIVSMISGQHYMDTKRYHEFLVWYTEKLRTLTKV